MAKVKAVSLQSIPTTTTAALDDGSLVFSTHVSLLAWCTVYYFLLKRWLHGVSVFTANASARVRCSDTEMPGVLVCLFTVDQTVLALAVFSALLCLYISFSCLFILGWIALSCRSQGSASLVVFVIAIACT
jgi:hypothetical protein